MSALLLTFPHVGGLLLMAAALLAILGMFRAMEVWESWREGERVRLAAFKAQCIASPLMPVLDCAYCCTATKSELICASCWELMKQRESAG